MPPNKIDQFRQDMLDAGHVLEEYYRRSSGYKGPAVMVERQADIQDIIEATSVRVQWTPWMTGGYVVYPA